ncbi:MAG: hypothetical protein QXY99_06625 [Thermoproteota archaeon]
MDEVERAIETSMSNLLLSVRSGVLDIGDVEKEIEKIYKNFPEHRCKVALEEITLYDKLRMWSKALEAAERATRNGIHTPALLMRKAKYLGIVGRIKEAAVIFEQLLNTPMEDRDALLVYAHYAKMLISASKWGDAISVLRRGLLRFPKDVILKTKLAICFKSLGNYEGALSILNSLDQNDPYIRMEKAHIYVNLFNAEKARSEMKAARALFYKAHVSDKRLRNKWERRAIFQRLLALEVAVSAVEGKVEEAEKWFYENHSAFPAAKLVGVVLGRIHANGSQKINNGGRKWTKSTITYQHIQQAIR